MASRTTVFGDQIFRATELARQTSDVLDEARERPVTITRNEESFALLRRNQALDLVESAQKAATMVHVLTAISLYRHDNKPVPADNAFEWINAFDLVEVHEMVTELARSFNRAGRGDESWEELDHVLHEWHESAIANRSDILNAAFAAPAEEVPVTNPKSASSPT